MLKIRLQRIGRKNNPAYRVVVTESTRGPKSGNYIEMLGSYDPKADTSELKADRIQEWIKKGAQVSGTVHNILLKQGVTKGSTINVLPKKSPIVKEAKEKEEAKEEKKAPETKEEGEKIADEKTEEKVEETPKEETPKEAAKEEKVEEKSEANKEKGAEASKEEPKEEKK